MEQQIWLLTVGEYADYHVLGVFVGDEEQARMRALELTYERAGDDMASDLIKVSYEKAEVL